MTELIKNKFGLTDNGARSVQRAAIISFFVNIGYMAFMIIAMYFGDNLLQENYKSAWLYLSIIAVTTALVYLLVDLEYVRTFNATYKEASDLRLEIADNLRELPLSYFSRHDLSDLAQTIMQDVADIEHAMSHAMPRCIAYILFLIIVGILLLIANFRLGLATLLPLVIGFYLMYLSKNLQRKWTGEYFWRARETTEAFQEAIELQREIKSCGMEEENFARVSQALDAAEKLRLRTEVTQALPILSSISIMKLSLGLIAVISASLLKANALELIYVIGFMLASVRLVDAVGAMEENFAELFYLDARVKRINELRETPIQQGKDIELKSFDLVLENVGFAYNDQDKVVDGASFVARQDEVTALVGPSGCGKSTILRLASRLYDYQEGSIIIDGYDIREISTDALFEKVSFVFQDVILFNASVLENIRMGRSDASDEEVKTAARLANCEDFILQLPAGYDTMIGENGSKLSGGERQRISIARAFLKDAPILLLDEISASLDVENEMKIQKALNHLTVGKTVIIVSHRLKSVEKVDKIVVMDKGKVVGVGTHEELLAHSALYQTLIEKSKMSEHFIY